MLNELKDKINEARSFPRWKVYFAGAVVLFLAVYLLWSFWPRPKPPEGMQQAKAAVDVKKQDAPAPQIIRVVDKQTVYKYLPSAQIAPTEQVIDTATIPNAPNGAMTVTTIDQQTGESRTQYELKKAPWLALERGNEIGIAYGINTDGRQTAAVHYRRDLLRIKDVHLSGQVEVSAESREDVEGRASIQANWRF